MSDDERASLILATDACASLAAEVTREKLRAERFRAALQRIADGYIDEGGGRRIHPDTLAIAADALMPASQ